jgi:hypothetical protein
MNLFNLFLIETDHRELLLININLLVSTFQVDETATRLSKTDANIMSNYLKPFRGFEEYPIFSYLLNDNSNYNKNNNSCIFQLKFQD